MSTYDSNGYAPNETEENVGVSGTDFPDMPDLKKAESKGINEPASINSDLKAETPEFDLDAQMEQALSDMMQMSTPFLDIIRVIMYLPAFITTILFMNPPVLYAIGQVVLIRLLTGTLDMDDVQELTNIYLIPYGLAAATYGVTGAIEHIEKEATEGSVRENLLEIFKNGGITIHSYNREKTIPEYLIGHSHLISDYNGSAGGDLINIEYRGHAISCCNIALTQPRTPALEQDALSDGDSGQETYIDQYKEDDIEAAARYSIKKGQDVVFYGSVFVFMPGPDIEGRISLEAAEPIEYLRNLKSMDETDILTNLVRTQDKKDVFDFNHRIREVSIGDTAEADRVFTQRVKDMVLQLELDMRAPVEIYADKNMVCMTIQKKAFDFDNMHSSMDIDPVCQKELENTLIEKVYNFRKILDTMITGDVIEISTMKGSKSAIRYREGVKTSMIGYFAEGSVWLQLLPGENVMSMYAEVGAENLYIDITSTDQYEGV